MSRREISYSDLQKYAKSFEEVGWIELASSIPISFVYGKAFGEAFSVEKGGFFRSFGAVSAASLARALTETYLVKYFARNNIDLVRQTYVPNIYRVDELIEKDSLFSLFPNPLYLTQNPTDFDLAFRYMVENPQQERNLFKLLAVEKLESQSYRTKLRDFAQIGLLGFYAAGVAADKGVGAALLEGIGAFFYGPSLALGIRSVELKGGV